MATDWFQTSRAIFSNKVRVVVTRAGSRLQPTMGKRASVNGDRELMVPWPIRGRRAVLLLFSVPHMISGPLISAHHRVFWAPLRMGVLWQALIGAQNSRRAAGLLHGAFPRVHWMNRLHSSGLISRLPPKGGVLALFPPLPFFISLGATIDSGHALATRLPPFP